MSAPVPLTDYRRVLDAFPGARIFPWTFAERDGRRVKLPAVKGWSKLDGVSTRDFNQLDKWTEQHNGCNCAVLFADGTCVVDLDAHDSPIETAIANGQKLGVNLDHVAGHSSDGIGWHVFYGGLDKLLRRHKPICPGVEILAGMGRWCAITEAGLASVEAAGALPDVPAGLIETLTETDRSTPSVPAPTEQEDDKAAMRSLNNMIADFGMATNPGRRDALNNAAFTAGGYHGAGRLPKAKETALFALVIENAENNGALEKYGQSALTKTWKDGFADGIKKPIHRRSTVRAKEREEAELKCELAKAHAVLSGQSLIDNGTRMQLARGALQAIGPACRYNTRRRQTEISMDGKWTLIGDWAYVLALQIADQCSTVKQDRLVPVDVKPANVVEALTGMSTRVDPFLAWLETRPVVDGTTTIDGFLPGHFGADPVIGPWAMRHILLTAVTRAYEPGYLVAEHVVLIGKGGSGKSAMLKHLLPPENRAAWHSDSLSLSMSRKEIGEILAGRVIVECGDMAGAASLKDLGRLKTMLTAVDDGGERGAFKVAADEQLRMQAIVFTGDTRRVLPPDDTGNFRRWAPVELAMPSSPVEPLLDQVRDTLWGEAMALYRAGERPSVSPTVQAALAPVRGRSAARADLIEHYVDQLATERYPNGTTIMQMLIDSEVPEQDRGRLAGRFGSMLAAKGWESARESREGKRETIWRFVGRLDLAARGCQGPGVARGLLKQCEPSPLPIDARIVGAAANTRNEDTPATLPTPATPGSPPEIEDLAGFDELMAEMICPQCGREAIPQPSGICGQCEALAR